MDGVAWFQIMTGGAIATLWTTLLVTHQVPQVAQGRRDIWFHVAAEYVTAVLLVVAGVAVLAAGSQTAALLAAVAAGALLYTTINSPGYYADLGQWPVVAMFATLAAAAVATAVVLVRSA